MTRREERKNDLNFFLMKENWNSYKEAKDLQVKMNVIAAASALVHETQKERGGLDRPSLLAIQPCLPDATILVETMAVFR